MNKTDIARDQMVLAQHHVKDIQETDSKDVVESSVNDIQEILDKLKKTLPKKDQKSVTAEKLANVIEIDRNQVKTSNHKVHNMIPKTAHAELTKKAAEIEKIDRINAFELGFAKRAHDAGLDKSEYQAIYEIACKKLEAK
jgi:hypothetical protein